jgi:ankyrin repeat protein
MNNTNYDDIQYLLNAYDFTNNRHIYCRFENVYDDENMPYTVLDYACYSTNPEIVKLFIDNGYNIGKLNLMCAVFGNKYNIVELLLLQPNIDINYVCSNRTALMIACCRTNIDIIRLLLNHGADVRQITFNSTDAMCYAIRHSDSSYIKLLVEYGYKITINTFDMIQNTYYGQSGCHPDYFQLLFDLCDNATEIADIIMSTDRFDNLQTFTWFDFENDEKINIDIYLDIIIKYISNQEIINLAFYRSININNRTAKILYKYGANLSGFEDWVLHNVLTNDTS